MATNNAINLAAQGVAYYNGSGTFSAPTLTQHGVIIGSASNDISSTAVGVANSVLIGNAGADPSFSTTPTLAGLTLATTPLGVASGGTGDISFTAFSVICGGTTSAGALQNVSGLGTSGMVLTSSGPGALPTWTSIVSGVSSVTGTANQILASPTTGAVVLSLIGPYTPATYTAHGILLGEGTSSIVAVSPNAASGIPFISQGSTTDPAYGTAVVAGGGTGSTTFSINGAVFSNTTTTGLLQAATLTSGQLLIGGTGAPAAGTLTAGTGVTIANGNNSITINATGGGVTWNNVTTTTASAAVNNGYLANNSGQVTITLPATAAQFTVIAVAGWGLGGWTIAQNALQNIQFGSAAATTTGTGGSLTSTNRYDTVYLLCTVANTSWTVLNSVGNLTIV